MGKHNDPEGCFWAKVSVAGPDDCWLWTGSTNGYGYGQINVRKKKIRTHRFSYILAHGEIPARLVVDHTCHNDDPTCAGGRNCTHRRCVNPAHLRAVTQQINATSSVNSIPGRNILKTTCPRGHEYDIFKSDGARDCRTCKNERRRNPT